MTTEWYTTDDEERLLAAWEDAPTADMETCGFILDVARDRVWAWAPESEDDDGEPVEAPTDATVPDRLALAQLSEAKNIWNAGRVNPNGDMGDGSFSYTPRPMDKTIKGMIRPPKGVFNVG